MSGDSRPAIVLLGASNLTRGLSTVVETLRLQYAQPLRIVTALGHGRSFGQRSRVLGRSLIGMLDCGMWQALEAAQPPSFALITDIGNDVMYGVEPATIVGWLEQCVDRLAGLPCGGVRHVNICGLPIDSIRRVKRWHYSIVKNIMFPTHDITYDTAMERSFEMQRLVEELAQRRGPLVNLVQHDREWYGFDPIHIRMKHWPATWARFLAIENAHTQLRAQGSLARWSRLRSHMPAEFRIFGLDRRREQPLRLTDGSTIEMY